MNKDEMLKFIKSIVIQVIPSLADKAITPEDNFKDIGANSMERFEISSLILEELDLDIQRGELLKAKNIGELAALLGNFVK